MTRALTLSLPTSAFDDLWQAAQGKAAKRSVDREALHQLLLDHSRALKRLTDMGVPFVEPEFEDVEYPNHPKVRNSD